MRFISHLLPLAAFAATTVSAQSDNAFTTALANGKVSLNVRPRFEYVDQSNLAKDASALTVRTALGYTTAPLHGFKATFEAQNVASPDPDAYNQAGINAGGAGRPVVADPVGTEITQALLGYTNGPTSATVGRQMIVLDNARFVGNVAWRQNFQTFDAATLKFSPAENVAVTYAYVDRVNRIFGNKSAQGNWDSNSHLFNISTTAIDAGTLTGYVYLLDFDNAAANSSATYGVSFAGSTAVADGVKLSYRAEYAVQGDHADNPVAYDTDYTVVEVGAVFKPVTIAIGYEVLGADNGVGFKTPLATLHAFNGWADVFLATPGTGLEDIYLKVAAPLPAKFGFLGFYHDFSAASGGADYGTEIDLQLTRPITKNLTGLVKFAAFEGKGARPDIDKFWVQLDFKY